MTQKTEEEIEKERNAILAMTNAKSHMAIVLSRNTKVEHALSIARERIKRFKSYVPESAYSYGGKGKLHDEMDAAIAEINTTLGDKA